MSHEHCINYWIMVNLQTNFVRFKQKQDDEDEIHEANFHDTGLFVPIVARK